MASAWGALFALLVVHAAAREALLSQDLLEPYLQELPDALEAPTTALENLDYSVDAEVVPPTALRPSVVNFNSYRKSPTSAVAPQFPQAPLRQEAGVGDVSLLGDAASVTEADVSALRSRINAARAAEELLQEENAQLRQELRSWRSTAGHVAAHEKQVAHLLHGAELPTTAAAEGTALVGGSVTTAAGGASQVRTLYEAAGISLVFLMMLFVAWRYGELFTCFRYQGQVLGSKPSASTRSINKGQGQLSSYGAVLRNFGSRAEEPSPAPQRSVGVVGGAIRGLSRRTGVGFSSIEISEIQVTNLACGGDAYVSLRAEGSAELCTEAVQLKNGVLKFTTPLLLDICRFGGPVALLVIDRYPAKEDTRAEIEIPAKELLRLVQGEPGEYFRFDLSPEADLRSWPMGAGPDAEAVRSRRPCLSARLRAAPSERSREANLPQSRKAAASAPRIKPPRGAVDEEEEEDELSWNFRA